MPYHSRSTQRYTKCREQETRARTEHVDTKTAQLYTNKVIIHRRNETTQHRTTREVRRYTHMNISTLLSQTHHDHHRCNNPRRCTQCMALRRSNVPRRPTWTESSVPTPKTHIQSKPHSTFGGGGEVFPERGKQPTSICGM